MVKAIKKFAKQFSSHKNQKQFKFYTMFRIYIEADELLHGN